ncbi:hypothetical protein TREMEDRAFT_58643 [Tremella mesenterica DSM 1558]|uniref:uncharacterized protein n=1 Tax=Tremella mesenterica (strain ATCC 24925 / CBS 8224 / DSM 1558 / NBRC 9311 / NRRL Y-6157 / RJB 2259-6 / UBC 559-6) TaxID=578456 RepID=UPI0003F48FF8|nr:uncharacterized protein TREMEDRAFT_58643 [Tremella mesenterica DSM 1558]EIW72473.1 hypothetical protein TREMEDRAFT_58643 [Tremella mesenterica DSM 1558]
MNPSTARHIVKSGRSPRTSRSQQTSNRSVIPNEVTDCFTYNANASVELALRILSLNTVYTDPVRHDMVIELSREFKERQGKPMNPTDTSRLVEPFQDMGLTAPSLSQTEGGGRASRRSSRKITTLTTNTVDHVQEEMIKSNYSVLHARADGADIPWNVMVKQLTSTARWTDRRNEADVSTINATRLNSQNLTACLSEWESGKGEKRRQHLTLAREMTFGLGAKLRENLYKTYEYTGWNSEYTIVTTVPPLKEELEAFKYVPFLQRFEDLNDTEAASDVDQEEEREVESMVLEPARSTFVPSKGQSHFQQDIDNIYGHTQYNQQEDAEMSIPIGEARGYSHMSPENYTSVTSGFTGSANMGILSDNEGGDNSLYSSTQQSQPGPSSGGVLQFNSPPMDTARRVWLDILAKSEQTRLEEQARH